MFLRLMHPWDTGRMQKEKDSLDPDLKDLFFTNIYHKLDTFGLYTVVTVRETCNGLHYTIE